MERVDVVVIGGGQAGLASARALVRQGLEPVVLEASDRPAGSWPRYYDGLTLFSPARYSALPGLPFPGDPDRYPHRDEVVAYLTAYAARLDADLRTGCRVRAVRRTGDGFEMETEGGERLTARAVVAASGSFGRPHRPDLPYLARLDGALDRAGLPRHRIGRALAHPGLAFTGLEWQRSLTSNSLRGAGRDAARTARRLAALLGRR
ncbi:FAD-dependent oxidoreductase [Streptomyces jumonjinensis]|uniref:FAD-dependent oxidoreductase n=1 Tax=Streptomyces jumonjinensis TaxID=1945 RepID=A0A646KTF3_STRJU|nr:FAD-dependent oxidoreductase [Streptomyces jumonjinensis]MQT05327.1 FAD-dependent oxidoreductase [Streptomyces jumonjinensis]